MKKLIYPILVLLSMTPAMAQENRGTLIPAKVIQRSIMLGGSITGAYKDINDTRGGDDQSGSRQEFDFDVKFGYFVLHDWAIGLRGTVNHYREKYSGSLENRKTFILAGPFTRYYLDNGLFGEASFAMGVNNTSGSIKTDINEIKGGIGYALFINPKVAIEPAIMVSRYKEKIASGGSGHITEFGPSVNLGLQVYLFRERELALLR
ncbi:MAG: hypothetical protein ACO1OQ_15865 [Rufibacter sp.]